MRWPLSLRYRMAASPRNDCRTCRRHVGAFGTSASLHLPGKVDGRAYRSRLCPIEIGLDLVMCLHARRHAETVRVGLEQELPLAQRDPNHHCVLVMHAHDQAVMDVPRRTRLGSLTLDLR